MLRLEEQNMARLPVLRREREAAPLSRIHDEMDDLISSFFGPWSASSWNPGRWPVLDVAEQEDSFIIQAEVPGCKAQDIDISVRGNTLTITGEKQQDKDYEKKGFYHIERSYGTFRRELNLASDVDPERIEADYKDGLLTINLPKTEKAKPFKVKVKEH